MKHQLACALALAACAFSSAQAGVTIETSPNRATAHVELGEIKADLELTFDQALGLTADSLGLTARLVNPGDLALATRLPASTSVPVAFPLLIAIEPPASGPLSFAGVVALDLHAHNLSYVAGSPLRLLAAEGGGPFQDITSSIGIGSYRTGASKGGFSEFLIAADLRPLATVIVEKFARLQSRLDAAAAAIPAPVLASLQVQLRSAKSAYDANDPLLAAERIEQFAQSVKQNSGTAIPDVWRSARDVVNHAGELRSGASTLKFSLLLKASGGS